MEKSRKKGVNKDLLKLNIKERCDANPISASEYDDTLKVIITHEQTKNFPKSFKGFYLVGKKFILNSGRPLKLIVLRSRVQNYPSIFLGSEPRCFALPNSAFPDS